MSAEERIKVARHVRLTRTFTHKCIGPRCAQNMIITDVVLRRSVDVSGHIQLPYRRLCSDADVAIPRLHEEAAQVVGQVIDLKAIRLKRHPENPLQYSS